VILIAVFAIYVIVTKRLRITRSTTVTGNNARKFGIALLVLTIPLSLLIGAILRPLLPAAARSWLIPQMLHVGLFAAAVLTMAYYFRDLPADSPANIETAAVPPPESPAASETPSV
jgi:hypothetical protein